MSHSLSKIEALKLDKLDSTYFHESKKLIAATSSDQLVKVYKQGESEEELNLIKEYKNHVGAIISIVFAPENYHTYMLSIGYDKSLYLYNLDDQKSNDAVFSYTEENEKIGYFTCVTFLPLDKTRLYFIVGTSTGELITFDSESSFEPKTQHVAQSMIKSVSGNNKGDIVVVSNGNTPSLFLNFNFGESIQFESNNQNSLKTNQVQFSTQNSDDDFSYFLTTSEDQTVGIWEINHALQFAKQIQTIQLDLPIINANWNLTGLSISVFCAKKDDSIKNMKSFRLVNQEQKGEAHWRVIE